MRPRLARVRKWALRSLLAATIPLATFLGWNAANGNFGTVVPGEVYRSAQMLGERCQFILGGSGHIQTIVCPPGNPKAFYYTNPNNSSSPEEWLRTANRSEGTWWDHFSAWCGKRSGSMVSAPSSPGSARHPSLGKAPGTYVFEKVR